MKLNNIKSFAIVLASGSGIRYNSQDVSKHLVKIKDVPIIAWTLNAIIKSKKFNKIIIVTRENDVENTCNAVSEFFDLDKEGLQITIGGQDRMDSFFNGISKLQKEENINKNDLIALIDSNRPFCTEKQIMELFNLAIENGCSCPARPVVNGVAKINNKKIIEVPAKENFVEFVTPEFIEFNILKESKKKNNSYKSLVEYSLNMFVNPAFSVSTELNQKLTYPEDFGFLEQLVNKHKIIAPLKRSKK